MSAKESLQHHKNVATDGSQAPGMPATALTNTMMMMGETVRKPVISRDESQIKHASNSRNSSCEDTCDRYSNESSLSHFYRFY